MQESAPLYFQFTLLVSHCYALKPNPHNLYVPGIKSTPPCEANAPATGQIEVHTRFPISCLGRLAIVMFSADIGAPPFGILNRRLWRKGAANNLLRERAAMASAWILGRRDDL